VRGGDPEDSFALAAYAAPAMTRRFEERWMETRSEPFEFEGDLVHSIDWRPIEPGTVIEVEFLNARLAPPQGIEVAVEKGASLAWDQHGVEGRAVRLWADKQPRASLRYVNPRKSTEVSIWNIWLETRRGTYSYEPDSYDIVQAWWTWSGMRIEESDDGSSCGAAGATTARTSTIWRFASTSLRPALDGRIKSYLGGNDLWLIEPRVTLISSMSRVRGGSGPCCPGARPPSSLAFP
jgi:hypothetical protein